MQGLVYFLYQNEDKARQNAAQFCDRLGAYRMPFAWTVIQLFDVLIEKQREFNQDVSKTDSLGKIDSKTDSRGKIDSKTDSL